MASEQEGETELSLETPADEAIERLSEMGLPAHVLEAMRRFALQGIHPLQVLRALQEQSEERVEREEEPRERMLESFDVEGVARYIAEKECKHIVVMCGAGISTSAGIPDFRTPGTGLYDNLQRFNLPKAEAIFEINFFRRNPGAFYELAKEMWPGNYDPTPAHYFIKLLSDKGILLRCYSQNIDSLERQAGLPEDQLIAAHGNFDKAHVVRDDGSEEPGAEVDIKELKAALDKGEEGWQELRREKGGLVKPQIVFFGESLPDRFLELYLEDLKQCDLLIVLGTSLVVAPFNSLVGHCNAAAPRLLVNREPAGTCEQLRFGFRFQKTEEGKNWRDVFHQGDCDSGCRALASALGWGEDLEALIQSKGRSSPHRAPWSAAL